VTTALDAARGGWRRVLGHTGSTLPRPPMAHERRLSGPTAMPSRGGGGTGADD
jgi:hypothetical protein